MISVWGSKSFCLVWPAVGSVLSRALRGSFFSLWGCPVALSLSSRRLASLAAASARGPLGLPSAAFVASVARFFGAPAALWRPSARSASGAVVCVFFPAWLPASVFASGWGPLGRFRAAGVAACLPPACAPVVRPCGFGFSVSVPVGALPAAFGGAVWLWGAGAGFPPCGGACGC